MERLGEACHVLMSARVLAFCFSAGGFHYSQQISLGRDGKMSFPVGNDEEI
jgi:hypothetical protein